MKSLCFALSVFLMSLSTAAFAQHEGHVAAAAAPAAVAAVAEPDAQKAFDQLKTLGGSWEGSVETTPKQEVEALAAVDPELPELTGKMRVLLRVASNGNAITHETPGEDGPHVDPLTVLYLEGDQLLMTHYCAFGNRPRMAGKMSRDGKTVEFDFVDVVGPVKFGHMHQATFTFIDKDHHTEDWVFLTAGDKPIRAHMDLHRVK